ncbi:MAG: hypothetical protein II837_11825, partial [Treponema sp.]|nr:hypothetical protein [Treponema sp.]
MLKIQKKFLSEAFPAVMLVFTFFCFGTASIFIKNENEFWFSYADLLPSLLLLSAIFLGSILLAERLMPTKAKKYFRAVVYAAAFSLFIQGNILTNNFGTLNGEMIDWSSHTIASATSAFVWITVFAGIIFATLRDEEKTKSACNFLLIVMLAMELGILVYSNLQKNESVIKKNTDLSTYKAFDMSEGNNTSVFLLDCFDAKLFTKLLEQD